MSGNGDIDVKSTVDHEIDLSYIRLEPHSRNSTCSSIVISSCSGDEKNNNGEKHSLPTLRWKRQKILNNDHHNTLTEHPSSGNDTVNNSHVDQSFVMSVKENVASTVDEERRPIPPRRLPPIPADKLHRRNPHTVRQEIKMFDDLMPETNLADVHLSEMPGLHNTEQWKRIADRAVHASPPLSRQYYQTVTSTLEYQNGQVPQPLGSYRRPGRSENEEDRPTTPTSRWRAPRRRIFFGSSIAVVVVAIVVAVVLAITLVQKTGQSTSDYYSGSVYVRAEFDQILLNPSSSLAKSYRREFCTLIATSLADTKTKYALFYSTCSVLGFRNGSIIADFVLGFTRPQNATRLSSYLNRTLVNNLLFGGTIVSVALNLTTLNQDNSTNEAGDYDDDDSLNAGKFIMTEPNLTNDPGEPSRTSSTIVTYTKLETATSTLEDLITRDTTTSSSTLSLNDEALLNSTSTLVNNFNQPTKGPPMRPTTTTRPSQQDKSESTEEKSAYQSRPYVHAVRRQRRMVVPKNQRRLLQYELMPTGKVYYVDRPLHRNIKPIKGESDENSSVNLSTILSRSSSLDTLSDKHYRRRHHHHEQQQQNRRPYQDLSLRKPEQKLSIGGRLASINNLPSTSPFKPINVHKKKRFSSFDPTPESLDRVFDVLIAADKRREEHEFWREKFDQRQPPSRMPIGLGRIHETTNSNTVPSIRSKQIPGPPTSTLNPAEIRSQSYTTKRSSTYESNNPQSGCLLDDCLRRQKAILQPQQRNYSPNVIYSTTYPKSQLSTTSKPPLPTPPTTTNQQPIRILPVANGRIGRAPQARQTSDELSSISDVWATRSSIEEESHPPKKPSNHARFQSTVNRHRPNEQKSLPNKRASSVEQQKSTRTQSKTSTTTRNKFFDLFKFTR